jgi:hypothetical protein
LLIDVLAVGVSLHRSGSSAELQSPSKREVLAPVSPTHGDADEVNGVAGEGNGEPLQNEEGDSDSGPLMNQISHRA